MTEAGPYSYLETPPADEYSWLYENETGAATAEWTETTFEEHNANTAMDSPVPVGSGWELLAADDAREARRVFAHEMNATPADALPKIGYAISSALLDRDADSVALMRQAVRMDAESILEVPSSPALINQAQLLIDRYRSVGFSALNDRDLRFMVAVMFTLKGELAMAYYAIDTSSEQGDANISTANLKKVLRAALNGEAPVEPQTKPHPMTPPQTQPAPAQKAPEVLY